jgi:protein-S-isoprenylcysteine O-methyltransferase Ste14
MEDQRDIQLEKEHLTKYGRRTIIAQYRWIFIAMVVFFLTAWNVNISRAWVYFGINITCTIISSIIFWKIIPELANRRGQIQKGTKIWDKYLILLYFLGILIIIPLITGLDIRFDWRLIQTSSTLILGICFYITSFLIFQWTVIVNKHFEGTARIQSEIDHKVVKKGPYSLIRHPGYLGMLIGGLSYPLVVGSFWGLIAYIPFAAILIIRTFLEDRMLVHELKGYKQYSEKTKFRLIPFIW